MSVQQNKSDSGWGGKNGQLHMLLYRASLEGYGESFRVTERGLYSVQRSRYYRAEQVRIIQKIHLDSDSSSSNLVLLYFIETSDGLKGTVSSGDDNGLPSGCRLFMKEAERIQKMHYGNNLH